MMNRRASDRWPISRAFVAALLVAVGMVIRNPDTETIATAVGVVAAAISGGVRKEPK